MKPEKRYTRRFAVTVGDRSTVVHTETRAAAIERATEKLYGLSCFWHADHGLPGYGQVFRPCDTGGASSVTHRAFLECVPVGNPSSRFIAQQRRDAEDIARAREHCDLLQRSYWAGVHGDTMPEGGDQAEYARGSRDSEEFYAEQAHKEELMRIEAEREELESIARQNAESERAKIAREAAIQAEIERVKADLNCPALLRRVAVIYHEQNSMPLGDFKRAVVSGARPDLVARYLSEKLRMDVERRVI